MVFNVRFLISYSDYENMVTIESECSCQKLAKFVPATARERSWQVECNEALCIAHLKGE